MRAGRAVAALLFAVPAWLGGPAPGRAADPPPATEEKEEAKPPRTPLPWEIRKTGEDACRPEEIAILRELSNRARLLDTRARALDAREAAAREVEAVLAAELARVDALRSELRALLDEAGRSNDENVASLARMVDTMKPKEAAPMLAGMDEDVALRVLETVKPKQAAKILGAMPASKAQALGDRFTIVPDPRTLLLGEEVDEDEDASGDAGEAR